MSRKLFTIIILILVASNVFFATQYFKSSASVQSVSADMTKRAETQKIASFLNLFVTKVLQADGEVSFEDRLKLENLVRDLNDKDILSKWQKFVDSSKEADAQKNLKDLLQLLSEKLNS